MRMSMVWAGGIILDRAGLTVRFLFLLLLALALVGCAGGTSSTSRTDVTASIALSARVPDLPGARYWGDQVPGELPALIAERDAQLAATRPALLGKRKPPLSFLALSGGGADGAFGAGILNGWSKAGTRPEFEVVTGISAGALMAPLAFLGPAYDATLMDVYTKYGTADLVNFKIFSGILGGPAVTGNAEMRAVVETIVTETLLTAIAREHARGRRLFVGTTNLDAQRPVIWDMGAIAASKAPNRLQLFRDVLLASAAIPGLLPPVLIPVQSEGRVLEEVHVDGGATASIFFLPPHIIQAATREPPKRRPPMTLYVISNGRLGPQWQAVQPSAVSIVTRSIDTLLKSQWASDISALYANASLQGIAFRLVGVPDSFTLKPKETFDKAYMKALYDFGVAQGVSGIPWRDAPPRIAGL